MGCSYDSPRSQYGSSPSPAHQQVFEGGPPLLKSACDVKALTYCDLKAITLSGLFDTLKMYPEFSEEFFKDIIHDLSYDLAHQMPRYTSEVEGINQ